MKIDLVFLILIIIIQLNPLNVLLKCANTCLGPQHIYLCVHVWNSNALIQFSSRAIIKSTSVSSLTLRFHSGVATWLAPASLNNERRVAISSSWVAVAWGHERCSPALWNSAIYLRCHRLKGERKKWVKWRMQGINYTKGPDTLWPWLPLIFPCSFPFLFWGIAS